MARRRKAAEAAADDTAELTSDTTVTDSSSPDIFDEQIAAQQNAAAPIVAAVAESTRLPAEAPPEQKPAFAQREQERRADPFPSHSYIFPDGYRITFQESDSRKTAEIQFGDGSRNDQPQNFEAIKPFLKDKGMHWNGSNAWVAELRSPPKFRRESLAEREDRLAENAHTRAHVEDVVLPTVLSLEEEKRGEITLTEGTRERINKAAQGR